MSLNDFDEFVKNFSPMENALDMRNLIRWNGRDLRNKENLSEHTHLVIVSASQIYDYLPEHIRKKTIFEKVIRLSMYHDSLELLRGDILSVTKDAIPGLRKLVDDEEQLFLEKIVGESDDLCKEIVKLADLLACYKFMEREIEYPTNNFALEAYLDTKNKFDLEFCKFNKKYGLNEELEDCSKCEYLKAYENDAGSDIILSEDCVFLPHCTSVKTLDIRFTPKKGEMGVLCSRTSAAKKGLVVANSPIDTDYTGKLTAIVHNISNEVIVYKKGESFCQLVVIPINEQDTPHRFDGIRTDGKLGSSGKC